MWARAALAAVLLVTLTACEVGVGDETGDGQLFGEGNSMQWDLTRPLEAAALGLPADKMVIVTVPENATVNLTLPSGTWSGRVEEMTVTTRHGYVDSVDLFWTEPDGRAATDRMVADAGVLGMDTAKLAGFADTATWAETADINRTRYDENFNGATGQVSISMHPSMAVGQGAGTPVRLWYSFYVRDVVEPTAAAAQGS